MIWRSAVKSYQVLTCPARRSSLWWLWRMFASRLADGADRAPKSRPKPPEMPVIIPSWQCRLFTHNSKSARLTGKARREPIGLNNAGPKKLRQNWSASSKRTLPLKKFEVIDSIKTSFWNYSCSNMSKSMDPLMEWLWQLLSWCLSVF